MKNINLGEGREGGLIWGGGGKNNLYDPPGQSL